MTNNITSWQKTLRSLAERRGISASTGDSLCRFFEQAFQYAQEPSASWFGFQHGCVSLVIGNYYLAAWASKRMLILVDSKAPSIPGFKVVRTGRSPLNWLSSSDVNLTKNLLDNPELWASYSLASVRALESPDGKPRKESIYRKRGKERLCDFWPNRDRGNLLQELKSEEPKLKVLPKTEAEAIRLSRIGQGRFRDSLLDLWTKCSITGCSAARILRASHIKPWADSSNDERLDRYNGLLLIPNLDAAFDCGLITFDDDGKIRLSSQLSAEDAAFLGIHPTMRISKVHKQHLEYLRYHRQHKFKQQFI